MRDYKTLRVRIETGRSERLEEVLPGEWVLEEMRAVEGANQKTYDYTYHFRIPPTREQILDITARMIDQCAERWEFEAEE